jgi:hypothetical protein
MLGQQTFTALLEHGAYSSLRFLFDLILATDELNSGQLTLKDHYLATRRGYKQLNLISLLTSSPPLLALTRRAPVSLTTRARAAMYN